MSIRPRRVAGIAAVVVIGAALAAYAVAWQPAIAPIEPPARAAFPAADIAGGAELAALGDCAVCHTVPNGPPYAGGRGVPTPFGTVHATNITPDPDTGIGRWSLPAFRRAMRDGVDRAGRNLYPVLPYPHFIHATEADIAAIYAFLMTRRPVQREDRANDLRFPFNARPLLAGWNLLFLRSGEWRPDPVRSPEWNRGAYLVEAIGHCGACHTPHNFLGAEQSGATLAGGEAEGWYAPPLGSAPPASRPWSADQLATYLRTGLEQGHGAAAGPMTAVTRQLATVPEEDVRALAVYIASLMPSPAPFDAANPGAASPGSANPGAAVSSGVHPVIDPEAIFDGACGACHGADAPMTLGGAPSLTLSTAVRAPTARNAVAMILYGLPWREGHTGPYMPAFAGALTDGQIAALADYLRARYTALPPWPDVEAAIQQAKRQGGGT